MVEQFKGFGLQSL